MSKCSKLQGCKSKQYSKIASWFPAFLIAILPKCPFCIMAYSGAVSMCSGKMLYPHADTTSSYILLGLSLVILLSLFFNRKGRITWIAVSVVLLGISMLVISQFYFISELLFYCAVVILFLGIWLNGSFKYFYRRYFYRNKTIKLLMDRFDQLKVKILTGYGATD